jgi:putative nucleotidyltransferase with HDIG domain
MRWIIFEEHPIRFRGVSLVTFIIAFIIEKYFNTEGRPTSLFVLVMVTVGMSLFNVFFQVVISFVVTVAVINLSPFGSLGLSFIEPEHLPHFLVFFGTQWFSYFVIGFIITYLIKIHIKEQTNTINFVKTLAKTLESKDTYTASHSLNVANYSKIIAERLNYSKSDCETIYIGALLHDIGKIGIKDSILNKPARLTNEEYISIQQHPSIGHDMLKLIENFEQDKILDMILYHHERYDGKGYPHRLKGDDIPEFAAIIAVADAFDAMTSRRIYREGFDLEYSINEIMRNSGTQFNPRIASTFIKYLKNEREEHFIINNNVKIS